MALALEAIKADQKSPVNYPWEKDNLKEELDNIFDKEKERFSSIQKQLRKKVTSRAIDLFKTESEECQTRTFKKLVSSEDQHLEMYQNKSPELSPVNKINQKVIEKSYQ